MVVKAESVERLCIKKECISIKTSNGHWWRSKHDSGEPEWAVVRLLRYWGRFGWDQAVEKRLESRLEILPMTDKISEESDKLCSPNEFNCPTFANPPVSEDTTKSGPLKIQSNTGLMATGFEFNFLSYNVKYGPASHAAGCSIILDSLSHVFNELDNNTIALYLQRFLCFEYRNNNIRVQILTCWSPRRIYGEMTVGFSLTRLHSCREGCSIGFGNKPCVSASRNILLWKVCYVLCRVYLFEFAFCIWYLYDETEILSL